MLAIRNIKEGLRSDCTTYGYSGSMNRFCPGNWDSELNCVEGAFNLPEWTVDTVLKQIRKKQKQAGLP